MTPEGREIGTIVTYYLCVRLTSRIVMIMMVGLCVSVQELHESSIRSQSDQASHLII